MAVVSIENHVFQREKAEVDRAPIRIGKPIAFCPRQVRYSTAKRLFDVVAAFLMVVVLSPLLLAIAALVKLTSRGPIIFKQTRVGLGGKEFTFYKFRSMRQDAEKVRDSLMHLNEATGPVFKIRDDPRMTPIGRVLRKLSLDELPQLLNVLKGEMSIVGPRPPIPQEVRQYGPREWERLSVRPGLTCLWQINGRSNIGFERWVELDLIYIETMTFWNDLWIVCCTVPAVLMARGAH